MVPFFRARRRKRIERQIAEVEERIADYKIAEVGLQVGNYSPAITTLRRIADEKDIEETVEQMVTRLARYTHATHAVLASPQVVAMNMRRMARNLERLSKQPTSV